MTDVPELVRYEVGVALGLTKNIDIIEMPADATEKDLNEALEIHVSNYVDSWIRLLDSDEAE